jgi:ribosomal protein L15
VVAHVNTVKLKNVRFVVQQGGYERFLREGRKNVHAFVAGELVEIDGPGFNGTGTEVVYNPRVSKKFELSAHAFSKSAKDALTKAGGTVKVLKD